MRNDSVQLAAVAEVILITFIINVLVAVIETYISGISCFDCCLSNLDIRKYVPFLLSLLLLLIIINVLSKTSVDAMSHRLSVNYGYGL